MNTLTEMLRFLKDTVDSDGSNGEAVDEVTFRVSLLEPKVIWQCNVKMRDRNKVWGTAVSDDPEQAVVKALDIALRGEKARDVESRAVYYEKREKAHAFSELLLMEYEDLIHQTKVEFVPYKGWVVVVFPKRDTLAQVKDLRLLVEVREADWGKPKEQAAPRRAPSGPTPAAVAAQGGRAALTKDKLEAEYKQLFGKYPDRNIKKLELAKFLDDEEAKRSLL